MNDKEARLFKNWLLLSIKAFLAVILGAITISNPDRTIEDYASYLGVIIILTGFSILYHSFRYRIHKRSIKLWIPEAIFDTIVGAFLILKPAIILPYILIIIATWILSVGIIQIFTAYYLKYEMSNWWVLFYMGLILCVLSFIIFLNPLETSVYSAILIGLFSVLTSMLVVYIARWIKKHQIE